MSSYNRKSVFIAACMGMLLFGIMMTTLGSILPSLFTKFGISTADAGTLFLLMSFGIMIGSLIFGPMVDRFGYKSMLIICTVLILLGLEGLAFTSSLAILKAAILMIGIGGGIINGGTNALVADIAESEKSADLSLLGVFFGVGAMLVPFVLGGLLNRFSYETILSLIGWLVAVPLVYFVAIRFPEPKIKQGFPIQQGIGLLKHPLLLGLSFILFFQSGVEIATGGWTSSFLNQELQLTPDKAVQMLSFYWMGMMGARLALNFILKKMSSSLVLLVSIGIGIIGSLCMIMAHSVMPAMIGLVLLGAGFASTYPVILGFVGTMYPKLSGTAFSIALVIALIGGMLIPYFSGFFGSTYGLRVSFLIVSFSLVCQVILFVALRKSVMKAANQ
ncbi:MAG: MFS transporter [Candidatus Delongbacteria bacterium]|nr:MFS transporter [Candidatus Delongbacteria bacterium]